MKTWQLQEAKAHFSKVVKNAINEGPQQVTLRGQSMVVVLSQKEFDSLKKPKLSFVEFMNNSPLAGADLKIKRDKSSKLRDIDL